MVRLMFDSASALRQRAMRCGAAAERTTNSVRREELLKEREGLLAMADNADWLAGRRPFQNEAATMIQGMGESSAAEGSAA